MTVRRPGRWDPGEEPSPVIDETLQEEGLELTNYDGVIPEHPGGKSLGPQPNPPRRPPHKAPPEEPADDPAEEPADS